MEKGLKRALSGENRIFQTSESNSNTTLIGPATHS